MSLTKDDLYSTAGMMLDLALTRREDGEIGSIARFATRGISDEALSGAIQALSCAAWGLGQDEHMGDMDLSALVLECLCSPDLSIDHADEIVAEMKRDLADIRNGEVAS